MEFIGKDVWRKSKEKVLHRRNWLKHNVKVTEGPVSSELENIIITSHKVALLSDDIVVDDV